MTAQFSVLAVAAILVAAVCALSFGLWIGAAIGKLRAERAFSARLAAERGDAVRRSRAVLGGQLSEQLAPFLPGFPAEPTEARFVGKPIDFIAFAGASRGCVDEVLFIEVKTGGSRLSPVEKSVRDAVRSGRVRYIVYRPDAGSATE